jgi:hypothetical protein
MIGGRVCLPSPRRLERVVVERDAALLEAALVASMRSRPTTVTFAVFSGWSQLR